jgi:hypothetical protein
MGWQQLQYACTLMTRFLHLFMLLTSLLWILLIHRLKGYLHCHIFNIRYVADIARYLVRL